MSSGTNVEVDSRTGDPKRRRKGQFESAGRKQRSRACPAQAPGNRSYEVVCRLPYRSFAGHAPGVSINQDSHEAREAVRKVPLGPVPVPHGGAGASYAGPGELGVKRLLHRRLDAYTLGMLAAQRDDPRNRTDT